MDDFDRAQQLNEDFQNYCLDHQRHDREPAIYTGTHCVDCSDEIPLKRREAQKGCCRCITCQEAHEIHTHWRL